MWRCGGWCDHFVRTKVGNSARSSGEGNEHVTLRGFVKVNYICGKLILMTHITVRIEREDDLRQLLELIRKLNLAVVQAKPGPVSLPSSERQKMLDYILAFKKDRTAFGDAAEWQRHERNDRELPWRT